MLRSTRDEWERLVSAVLRRENDRKLCYQDSILSDSSVSSSFSSHYFTEDIDSFSEYYASPPHELPTAESSPVGNTTSAATKKAGITFKATNIFAFLNLKSKRQAEMKPKFSKKNGGLLLKQKLMKIPEVQTDAIKLFTLSELKKATNNFNENMIIGRGCFGNRYKGILPDNRIVAIKKSREVGEDSIQAFINEVTVLSQINHRNVVRLLGCCVETEVPLLVSEFIDNGTLYQHIHNGPSLPWDTRLRIAAEVAGALSYLHSSVSIIHRNVKSSNILLDRNFKAKVYDFGSSRLMPVNCSYVSTLVCGTFGYVDPEYYQTSHLTEKSDVYSFGVVLVELLTGRKAISMDSPEEERNLASFFKSIVKEERLFEFFNTNKVCEANWTQFAKVAKLAERCLNSSGVNRPSMKEVVIELESLKISSHNSLSQTEQFVYTEEEEMESWINEEDLNNFTEIDDGDSPTSVESESLRDHYITSKTFSSLELEKASNNFHDSMLIGRGGYGAVYKGFLQDGMIVAIKKSKQVLTPNQIEQFVNEVIVLSQINHRNIVLLLGCCLEGQFPLLVYEFISNGPLSKKLHDVEKACSLSWDIRLRIAAEVASALSCLHSLNPTLIIHGDVKSDNILLDDELNAKVSDFGLSRLVPQDKSQVFVNKLQGTFGYLDPEYLQTGMLSEKNDIYSFGVVLVELLTGRKAFSHDRPEEERVLASFFLSMLKEEHLLFEILDPHIVSEERNREQIIQVAKLAEGCLSVRGKDRPSMEVVAMELEGLRTKILV